MVALYFSAYPNEAKKYYDEVIAYELEEEKRQEELEDKIIRYDKHQLICSNKENAYHLAQRILGTFVEK